MVNKQLCNVPLRPMVGYYYHHYYYVVYVILFICFHFLFPTIYNNNIYI